MIKKNVNNNFQNNNRNFEKQDLKENLKNCKDKLEEIDMYSS